jgi:hypothetical protein
MNSIKYIFFIIFFFNCTLFFPQVQLEEIKLPKKINETSGLEYIGENFITLNDSGDEPKLYEFNDKGELLKLTRFYTIINRDWEDITFDGEKYYIADVGNNYGTRKNLTIYIIDKKLNIFDSIKIKYKNQKSFDYLKLNAFDAEALISVDDSLVLFSKNRKNLSTEIYVFPETPGKYELQSRISLNVESLITGGDYNEKYKLLALSGYDIDLDEQYIYVFNNFNLKKINSLKFVKYKLPIRDAQIEAIKIIDNKTFWVTSESERFGYPRLIKIKL